MIQFQIIWVGQSPHEILGRNGPNLILAFNAKMNETSLELHVRCMSFSTTFLEKFTEVFIIMFIRVSILPFPKIVSWRFFKKNLNLNRFNSLHESC